MSIYYLFGCFLLCSTRVFALNEQIEKMGRALHNECVADIGVDEKFIEECRKGVFPEDPKLKCYMKCLLTKMPLMSADGDIDVEMMIVMVPAEYVEIAEPIIRSCGTVKGTDNCDTAFLTNKCWYSTSPENYFLI